MPEEAGKGGVAPRPGALIYEIPKARGQELSMEEEVLPRIPFPFLPEGEGSGAPGDEAS